MQLARTWRRLQVPVLCLLLSAASLLPAQAQRAVKFESPGVQLPGSQLQYDGGFDFVDWNGDGLLDLLLPVGGFHSLAVQQNEGSATDPLFTYGLRVPLNLTETVPQTVEHNQTFAFGDLNGDGLFDLIVFDGELRLILNTGRPYAPNHWNLAGERPPFFPGSEKMIKENARYVTGPERMFWGKGIFPRLVLTLAIADWDGDGLQDLIICRFAVRSLDAAGERSALSNNVETVTPPLRRTVLRKGPEGPDGVLPYQGSQACYLDARKPAEVMPRQVLEVYARGVKENNPRVILLRFRDLPALGNLQRATVSLTTPRDPNLLQAPHWPTVACYAVRDDWEVDAATWTAAAPGRPWAQDELTNGGVFLAHDQPQWTVEAHHTLTWDVTAAVRQAQREGRKTLSLLLRADYTGPYIAELGYRLCGADHPDPSLRPRLTLISRGGA